MYLPLRVSLIALAACTTTAAESVFIEVEDPRAVAAAIAELEKTCDCVITYEDPEYLHPSEIELTDEGQLIPRWEKLSVNVVQCYLDAYAAQADRATFRVEQSDGIFHVYPVKSKSAAGVLEPHESILDHRISFSAQDKSGAEILEMITTALTEASGKRVVPGTVPMNALLGTTRSYEIENEKTRVVLTRLLSDLGGGLSWQILHDPKLKWYVVNVHRVPSQ